MNCYYFLPEDFAGLQTQIQNITKRIKDIGKEMGTSCTEGAETYHDNFAYEEGERQQFMWSKRLCELQHVRKHAQIYTPKAVPDRVRLGSLVTYVDEENGDEKTIRIGSYLNFNEKATTSYNAPMARAMLGKAQGDVCSAEVCGRKKRFEIIEIK